MVLHQLFTTHFAPYSCPVLKAKREATTLTLRGLAHMWFQAQSLGGICSAVDPKTRTQPLSRVRQVPLVEPLSTATTASTPELAAPPSYHFLPFILKG